MNTGAIGVMSIDLGSEWIKIAIVKPGVPMEIVLNKESKRKTEVAVYLKDGEREFGSSAIGKGVRFPKNTYIYLQELLGKSLNHPMVQLYQKRFPYYDLIDDPDTGTVTFVHDAEKKIFYSPEELMGMMLNYSRNMAEEYAQQPIDACVLTVPAYFNQAERKSLLYAADLAGLKVSQLMDDNTAAALNYGVFRRHDINTTATYMMFYDMGSSSTTATVISYQVVKVNGIADPQVSVKGVGFDRTLGGLEMELRLRDHLVKRFNENKKTQSDVTKNPRSMAKLFKEARRLKKVLSANVDHRAQIEGLIDDEDMRVKVTREEFENLCSDLWDRVAQPMKDALKSSELTMDLMSQILLIGGGTRVPKVQEILLKESGNEFCDVTNVSYHLYCAPWWNSVFRVKTFHVKAGAVYPIEIEFDRRSTNDEGVESVKQVKRTLFQRNNPYPQRKVITFNRFYEDFNFTVNYGDLSFLTDPKEVFDRKISQVALAGVATAHEKYGGGNETESKGVKAHFRMDESGVLNLESVESVYEMNKTVEAIVNETIDVESTLQKIKDGFSSLFGGSEDTNATKPDTAESDDKSEHKTKTEEKMKNETKSKVEEKTKTEQNETKKMETRVQKVKKSFPLEVQIMSVDHEEPPSAHKQLSEEKSVLINTITPNSVFYNIPSRGSEEKRLLLACAITIPAVFVGPPKIISLLNNLRLEALSAKDAWKLARETAINKLESYIYDKRDKLYQEEYEQALTNEEREAISTALSEASDWMDELEGEPGPEVFNEKRQQLKDIARPWLRRVKQRQDTIPLMEDLESSFNYSSHFLQAVLALPEEAQIYTPVEITTLGDLIKTSVDWKNETVKAEAALKPYEDPVLKPDDIKQKLMDLNREMQYLINKAKTAKPKKPKTSSKKNETKSTTDETTDESTDGPTNTTIEDTGKETNRSQSTTQEATLEEPPTEDTKKQTESSDSSDSSNASDASGTKIDPEETKEEL
uniref:Hypoxia up-regulated protein 1 n=1 Tax=Ciona savignyi TaxID=51511 RepID=H2YJQ0_CIOSA